MTEVRIHHAHDVRGGDVKPGDDRGAQPELAGAMDDAETVALRELVGELSSAIR
jgi:hypothetical protein